MRWEPEEYCLRDHGKGDIWSEEDELMIKAKMYSRWQVDKVWLALSYGFRGAGGIDEKAEIAVSGLAGVSGSKLIQ